jgi:hypothetical protein
VHPKLVQDFLGHSSIMTTLDTYSHVVPAIHDDGIRKLDVILGGDDATDNTELSWNLGVMAQTNRWSVGI